MDRKDILLTIFVMLLWALCFPLISLGLSASPPFLFAGLRSLIAGVVLLIPAVALGQSVPRGLKQWLLLIGVGLSFTAMGFAGMFLGGGLVSPGIATVLANIQPFIAAILAYLFLRERLDGYVKKGLFIGFLGILLIAMQSTLNGSQDGSLGTFFILIGALGVAIGNTLMKKLVGKIETFMAIGIQFMVGSIVLFALSYMFEQSNQIIWGTSFSLVLFTLGIFGTALPVFLWFILLQRSELTRLNTFSFLTPAFGLILGAIFFSEQISFIEGIGIILIIGATYVVGIRSPKKLFELLKSSWKK